MTGYVIAVWLTVLSAVVAVPAVAALLVMAWRDRARPGRHGGQSPMVPFHYWPDAEPSLETAGWLAETEDRKVTAGKYRTVRPFPYVIPKGPPDA